MIKSRSVYQSYLGSHMIENTQGQEGWVALEQLDLFLPILRELFAKHQGLKIHLSATTMFYMSIGTDPTVQRLYPLRGYAGTPWRFSFCSSG